MFNFNDFFAIISPFHIRSYVKIVVITMFFSTNIMILYKSE